ncbi:MAG: DUF2436 domain-containing protein, partial [Bacteroidales bacterium]|nr:DUF2436 domain-containing protein [Bacteroidales bacterium]
MKRFTFIIMALLVAVMGFAQNKSSANLKSKMPLRTIVPQKKSTVQNPIRALRSNESIIILSAGDVWGDGSGYQMLLDADATAYGSTIPATGNLSSSGDVSSSVYDQFEYKIPVNADGACNTSNIILNSSVAINVPAGTYDWCITNPTPGDKVYIASSNGNIPARYDNYVFEAGKIYTFSVSYGGENDQVDLTIEDMPTGPTMSASETEMSFYNDINSTNEASTITILGMNLTANITATVTAPFSVSTDNNTFGTTATLGTIGGTLYVNYSPITTGTNTGTLTLTSAGAETLTITLHGTAFECNTIYAPWIETFDPSNTSLYCWSIIDYNQDGTTFGLYNYSGNYGMSINYTDQNNDFLISPSLYIATGDYLTFKVAHRGSYPETYQVYAYVDDNLTSIRNATQTTTQMPEFETITVDLSSYVGQTIQIAIRNTSADQWTFYLDDFIFHNTPTAPEIALTSVVPANGSSIAEGQELSIGGVITNNGVTLNSYKISYSVDGGNPVEYTVSGLNIENLETHSFTHPTTINGLSVGSHTIVVTVSNPNGVADNNSDNSQTITINVADCSLPISTFPYVEDFENGANPCWTLVDADGDGYGWVTGSTVSGIYYPEGQNIVGSGHNSSNMFVSGSFTNATSSALTPDNWAISPAIDLTTATTAQLSFFAAAQDRDWPEEHYGIYVSTTTTDPSAFTLIWEEDMDANGGVHSKAQSTWGAKHADLSNYVGQTIYIGFRHFNCTNAFLLLIDDIVVNVTYTVTVLSNNDAFGTANGGGIFDAGTEISISATPAEHYHFVSWDDGNTDNPRTVTVSDAATYTAIFAIDQFTITVDANNETMGTADGSGTYDYGEEIQISANPAEHYHFVQWSDSNNQNPRTITVTDNASYTAEFAIDQHTVMVASANNDMGTVNGGGTFDYGTEIQISATAVEHYHFVQWNDGNTDNPRTVTVTGDIVYVATFAIDQFNITVVSANETMGTANGGGMYDYNAEIQISATPAEHYHFVSWNDGNTDNPRTITVTEDASYTATFAIDQFTITVVSDNESIGTTAGSGTYDYGEEVQISANPIEHYHFVSWNDGNTDNPRTITVTDDANYTATFAIDQFTITVDSNNENMGTTSGSGTYNYGEEIQISATPAEHYHFVSWNDGNTDNPRTITVTENASYTATFAIDQFTITVVSDNESIGTTAGSGTYDYGEEVQISANPIEHYHFVSWNDGNTDNPRTITVTEDANYTATFTIDQFTITVDSNNENMGTTSGSGTYNYGEEIQISATPAEHYHFVSWNDGNTDNPRTITVTENASYTATFAIDQFTITVVSDNETMGTTSGSGTYGYGDEIQISATPVEHYRFVQWNDNDTNNPRTITVTEDATYTAYFEAIPQYVIDVTSSNDEYGTAVGGGTFDEGTTITINAIPNDGYVFTSWDDGNTENPRTIIVTENASYVANFVDILTTITFTITATPSNEAYGTVTGGGTYAGWTIIELVATANDGYRFVAWDDNNTENPRQITVLGDANYTAIFEAIPTYDITVNITGNGTVTYNGETVEDAETITIREGENVALSIVADANHHIESVIVDETNNVTESLVDGVYTFESVTADHTIDATFAINNYTLTIHYVYADNSPAEDDYTATIAYGSPYSVESPEIIGYTPNQAFVAGTMPAEDVVVNVIYNVNNYNLTIHYVYADNSPAEDDYTATVAYGSPYSVESPEIIGYTPNQAFVAGTMPAEDVVVNVIYNVNN